MTIKDRVTQQIEKLSEPELRQLSDYLDFMKFRSHRQTAPHYDPEQIGALYAEFAEEDRLLAEEGLSEYREGLSHEDAA